MTRLFSFDRIPSLEHEPRQPDVEKRKR